MGSKYALKPGTDEHKAFWLNDLGHRRCTTCKQYKELDLYHKDKGGPFGRAYNCKACVKVHHKAWYDEPSRRTAKRKADNEQYYIRQYGVSSAYKRELLEAQENACAICGTSCTISSHLDHCHTSGHIRGVLCHNCNRGLGYLQDDIQMLKNAIAYLEKHSESAALGLEVGRQ